MSANSLRLHCFGGLWLEGPAGPLADASSQRRRLALLALIAAAGPAGMSRDRVLAMLWPENDSDRARRALAQLMYSMRRSLGCALIVGEAELRLDPDSLTSDVGQFLGGGTDLERARLYAGPFLDGFHLTGAPEFGHWVERERGRLAAVAHAALEGAARAADGDHALAIDLWRRRAALTPLDPTALLGLMNAHAAAGDPGAAIRQAQVFASLVRAELELEPDPRVDALAAQLRAEMARPSPRQAAPAQRLTPHSTMTGRRAGDAPRPLPSSTARRWRMWVFAAGAVLLAAMAGRSFWPARPQPPVLAVTDFRFTTPDSGQDTHTFTDMLATSLARLDNVQVLSNGRVQEALASLRRKSGEPATLGRAAAAAGATELFEGSVDTAEAGLQAEIRRVDVATGTVRGVYRVSAPNLFQLVDAATAALAADLGTAQPTTALADVTTHSLAAYRLYAQGVRLYNLGDAATSYLVFEAALSEDSLFPMAAYYAWRSAASAGSAREAAAYQQLRRVQGRGSERERLFIQGTVATGLMDLSALAIAETLAIRFPSEPDAHLLLGNVRAISGDFIGAMREARRVREMESDLGTGAAACRACDAYLLESGALLAADSLAAAESVARHWLQDYPNSVSAAGRLAETLERAGRFTEANALLLASDSMGGRPRVDDARPLIYLIRQGRFGEADARLRVRLKGTPAEATSARWLLLISLRSQGRFHEALELARQPISQAALPPQVLGHAYFEAGELSAATAALDSLAALQSDFRSEGTRARSQSWALAHLATSLAAQRDTARLADVAIQLERVGARSLYGRDRIAFHYARGMLLIVTGKDLDAEQELRAAMFSRTEGFSRVNFELGRLYLRHARPRAALDVIEAALRGPIDASSYYVTQTELRELLAQAYDTLGIADSAAMLYHEVASAWSGADEPYRQRATMAAQREAELLTAR